MMLLVSASERAPHPGSTRWRIVVPVRGGPVAKTRLTRIEGRELSPSERVELALAMALDTVAAARDSGCGPVTVRTADPRTATVFRQEGVAVSMDGGGGLNAEIAAAATESATGDGITSGVVVLLGDLPALRADDVRDALAEVVSLEASHAYVPDREGTGTTLVAVRPPETPLPLAFGPGSAHRHSELGFVAVGAALTRLRCDVDTPDGWERALALGLGPASTRVRAALLGPVRR